MEASISPSLAMAAASWALGAYSGARGRAVIDGRRARLVVNDSSSSVSCAFDHCELTREWLSLAAGTLDIQADAEKLALALKRYEKEDLVTLRPVTRTVELSREGPDGKREDYDEDRLFLEIRARRSSMTVPAWESASAYGFDGGDVMGTLRVGMDDLALALRCGPNCVSRATGVQSWAMGGAQLLWLGNGRALVQSTDGIHSARVEFDAEYEGEWPRTAPLLAPRFWAAIAEGDFLDPLEGEGGFLEIQVRTGGHLSISREFGGVRSSITSGSIEGRFPNIDAILGDPFRDPMARVDSVDLKHLVRQAMCVEDADFGIDVNIQRIDEVCRNEVGASGKRGSMFAGLDAGPSSVYEPMTFRAKGKSLVKILDQVPDPTVMSVEQQDTDLGSVFRVGFAQGTAKVLLACATMPRGEGVGVGAA